MSWFSNIFSNSNSANAATSNNSGADVLAGDNINVLEGLFVNNQPPALALADNAVSLKTYLGQDFQRMGFEDGYKGHATELLENKIRSLKADFRYAVHVKMDAMRQQVLQLEHERINVEGMSERLIRQLDNKIYALNANLGELEAETAMADIDQGYVMIGILQFRDGYIRGTEAYHEEKMIAGNTGLFL